MTQSGWAHQARAVIAARPVSSARPASSEATEPRHREAARADGIAEHARRLGTPVDVQALVAAGVLLRRRLWHRVWYEVLDASGLSEASRCQIIAMRVDGGAALVQFRRRSRIAERLYEELTGEPLSRE